MIPTQELRIGNRVMKQNTGDYYTIQNGADIDGWQFLPVPVTPEVLVSCGFAFHSYFKLWQKNKDVPGTGPDMELDRDFWALDFMHRRIGVELKALHQLQNLYFSLKGKELEIKD